MFRTIVLILVGIFVVFYIYPKWAWDVHVRQMHEYEQMQKTPEMDLSNARTQFFIQHPESREICKLFCPDWYIAQHKELQGD